MPAPRTAGAAVTLGEFIYLVGGTTSQAGSVPPTWQYDPASDTWKDMAPLKQPREHNAAVVLDGKIYAIGGTDVGAYLGKETLSSLLPNSAGVYTGKIQDTVEVLDIMKLKK